MRKFYVVVSVLGFGMVDGMLTPVNTSTGIVSRTETSELETRSTAVVSQQGQDNQNYALVRVVNSREIGEIVENENTASIAIRDLFRSEQGSEVLGDWYIRDYPLQRRILSYQHNVAAGVSYPVEEHFVDINDLQLLEGSSHVVLNDGYINTGNRIAQQRRNTGLFANDDINLRARELTEIFIPTESGNVVVDGASARADTPFTAYTLVNTNTIDVGTPDSNYYQRTETSEQWHRPDGTIYIKRTAGGKYVSRPAATPPAQPAQQTVYNQPAPQQGGNRDIIRNVATLGRPGSDCNIM